MDEILWCNNSSQTSSAVLSHPTIYLVCRYNLWVCGWNPIWCDYSSEASSVVLFISRCSKILEFVIKCFWCDHSNENSLWVFSHGATWFIVQCFRRCNLGFLFCFIEGQVTLHIISTFLQAGYPGFSEPWLQKTIYENHFHFVKHFPWQLSLYDFFSV